ncbi:hypothetical protein Tco_1032677 [Tanacetum coccineum]|uniref:Uncharacterized protein n=1 Tax=Tanacetum coccineum TaxID=301880 RepID=A0ABQ5GDX9_9ASTR
MGIRHAKAPNPRGKAFDETRAEFIEALKKEGSVSEGISRVTDLWNDWRRGKNGMVGELDKPRPYFWQPIGEEASNRNSISKSPPLKEGNHIAPVTYHKGTTPQHLVVIKKLRFFERDVRSGWIRISPLVGFLGKSPGHWPRNSFGDHYKVMIFLKNVRISILDHRRSNSTSLLLGRTTMLVLTKPKKSGRVAKWAIKLGEHDIVFRGMGAVSVRHSDYCMSQDGIPFLDLRKVDLRRLAILLRLMTLQTTFYSCQRELRKEDLLICLGIRGVDGEMLIFSGGCFWFKVMVWLEVGNGGS